MALAGRLDSPQNWQVILAHWLWALPCLLVVAWLGVRQAELYPPSVDEFYSMVNVGFAADSLYSPGEVLDSLRRNSANHTPLYFLLLNLWARLVGAEIALARVLTVFCGILSLAVIYRLTRDFVAPLAGIVALVVAASNTFFNFYFSHARMYPLLALLSGVTLWLYLRLAQRRTPSRRADYLALAAATYALANTHVFSAPLFLALGAYHLLHARKDERWLKVSLSIGAGLLLFAPQLPGLLDAGVARSFQYLGAGRATLLENISAWLAVTFNGSWLLVALSVAGWLVCVRSGPRRWRAPLWIALYFALALLAVMAVTDALDPAKMRFALAGFPIMSLCLAAAIVALAAWRWWLGILTLLWLVAGMAFQQIPDWQPFFNGRELAFQEPPWQVLSRHAQADGRQPTISWYRFGEGHLVWGQHMQYPQSDYYFADRGIDFNTFVPHERFVTRARHIALSEPWHWVVYDRDLVDQASAAALDGIMSELNYRACERLGFGLDGALVKYGWTALDCGQPSPDTYANELVDYEFHAAALSPDNAQLLVVDRWLPHDEDPPAQTRISHQLLDADWQRVASLDLPLANRPGMRQSSLDVSQVAPGEHRLAAIIYNSESMRRSAWLNGDSFDNMLQLATIAIPES